MNIIEIYGTANNFSGSFDDDGNHHGQTLLPCPFCGKDDALEICNTHTPVFWIACECGSEMHGEYVDGAGNVPNHEQAYANYRQALVSAVSTWNTRHSVQPVAPVSAEREHVRHKLAETEPALVVPAATEHWPRVRVTVNAETWHVYSPEYNYGDSTFSFYFYARNRAEAGEMLSAIRETAWLPEGEIIGFSGHEPTEAEMFAADTNGNSEIH